MQTFAASWPVFYVRTAGMEFACLGAGSGPLVLCLHGFPDSAWSLRPLLAHLAARGLRAVAPFMRGYPPSSIPPDGDYRMLRLGRDALALIDALGAERAYVVGHDWGAVAAYCAANLAPRKLAGIVTAAVPHLRRFLLHPTPTQLRRSRYMAQFQSRRWADAHVATDGWLETLVREWSPGWAFSDEDLAPLRAALRDTARRNALLGYYRAIPRALLDAEHWQVALAPVRVPARVIHGLDDGCIGAEMFTDQDHLFAAGLESRAIEQAGHFMHCEQPQVFNQLVEEFVTR